MMLLHKLSLDTIKKPVRDIRRIYNKWVATLSLDPPPLIDAESRDSLEITIPSVEPVTWIYTASFVPTIPYLRQGISLRRVPLEMNTLRIMDYIQMMLEETDLGENDLSAITVEDEDVA